MQKMLCLVSGCTALKVRPRRNVSGRPIMARKTVRIEYRTDLYASPEDAIYHARQSTRNQIPQLIDLDIVEMTLYGTEASVTISWEQPEVCST